MAAIPVTERIDAINIGLMLISCLLAFVIPFELFLFSYAVLGPLHYLTEIGWLHKKGYFTKGKNDYIFLGLLCILLTMGYLGFSDGAADWGTNFICLGFGLAFVFAFIKDNTIKSIAAIVMVFATIMLSSFSFYELFFAVYLPTIIHVFLFTAAFMLFGALKSNSRLGIISVILLFLLASLFFIIPFKEFQFANVGFLRESYGSFAELNRQLINLLQLDDLKFFNEQAMGTIFSSKVGFIVMRFVAFAYTYHYLNWFSKTSVIQWHKVSKKVLTGVVAIWIISVGLYLYNYALGLKWLFLLSFLHVMLEFPLNFKSFAGIGEELMKRFKGQGLKKATGILLMVIGLTFLIACKSKQKTPVAEENLNFEGLELVTVEKFEVDGCNYMLKQASGKRLQPANLPDSLWTDGLQIYVSYKLVPEAITICMAGDVVNLQIIKKAK